jgi:hypothetical protein
MTSYGVWPVPLSGPLPMAAPAWLFHALLLLTFVLHLLAMNTLAGGAVLAGVTRLRRNAGPHHVTFVRRFGTAAPVLTAATVTFGVAPLLFLQVLYGRLFFPSSIVMAWWWLGVVPLLIAAYSAAYALAMRHSLSEAQRTFLYGMVAAILLLIAFVYVNNMTMMLSPGTVVERYMADGTGRQLNLGEAVLVPRYLHFVLSAIAIAALVLAVSGHLRRAKEPEFAAWAVRFGLGWFAVGTILNSAAGTWWMLRLPDDTARRLLGGDAYATAAFVVGTLAGLVALGSALVARATTRPSPLVWTTTGATLVSLVAMVLIRDSVRQAALERIGYAQPTLVATQWGPIAIFIVLLVAAIATVVWMVVKLVGVHAPR